MTATLSYSVRVPFPAALLPPCEGIAVLAGASGDKITVLCEPTSDGYNSDYTYFMPDIGAFMTDTLSTHAEDGDLQSTTEAVNDRPHDPLTFEPNFDDQEAVTGGPDLSDYVVLVEMDEDLVERDIGRRIVAKALETLSPLQTGTLRTDSADGVFRLLAREDYEDAVPGSGAEEAPEGYGSLLDFLGFLSRSQPRVEEQSVDQVGDLLESMADDDTINFTIAGAPHAVAKRIFDAITIVSPEKADKAAEIMGEARDDTQFFTGVLSLNKAEAKAAIAVLKAVEQETPSTEAEQALAETRYETRKNAVVEDYIKTLEGKFEDERDLTLVAGNLRAFWDTMAARMLLPEVQDALVTAGLTALLQDIDEDQPTNLLWMPSTAGMTEEMVGIVRDWLIERKLLGEGEPVGVGSGAYSLTPRGDVLVAVLKIAQETSEPGDGFTFPNIDDFANTDTAQVQPAIDFLVQKGFLRIASVDPEYRYAIAH